MATWFYTSRGQQFGPVEESQIRAIVAAGHIASGDLVWREGLPQWVSAAEAGLLSPGRLAPIPSAPVPVQPLDLVPAMAGNAGAVAAPVQLSYAAPAIVAAPILSHDEGPFLRIGKQFRLPGGRWSGVAVASAQAFYLLKVRQHASGVAYGVGGIAGMLLRQAFAKVDDTRTCALAELPHPTRLALDPKGKRTKGDVIVFPKEAIRLVKFGKINSAIAVHVGSEKFGLYTGLFGKSKARQFLLGAGWVVNQETVPTAAPIHGRGFGRRFDELNAAQPGTAKRVAFAILGIVILLLYIASRLAR